MEPLRVGVVGVGGMGTRHAHNLHHHVGEADVAGVVDADEARAVEVASRYGAQPYGDTAELIDAVDAVVVASPDPTHADLALACVEAGKPTLCEKPLATTVEGGRTVVDAEVAGGRRLIQVGFMREYDPAHLAVKEAVDGGLIGSARLLSGWHRNLSTGTARTIEDAIFNSAVHDLHSARWLLGREIEEVFVREITAGEGTVLVTILLSMASGALASIEVNLDSGYGYEVGVEVTGSAGVVRTGPPAAPVVRAGQAAAQAIDRDWLTRFEQAYVVEARQWIRSVLAGRPSGPSAWDGYVSLLAARACVDSAQSGQPQAVASVPRPALYGSGG